MKKTKIKFIAILSGIAAFVLAFTAIASSVMTSMSNDMDTLLGKGKAVKISSADLDGQYYDYQFDTEEEALKYAQAVTQKTAEEGMVLLRNDDSALPLKGDALKVTLLGYYGWHNNMSGGEDPATTYGAVSLYKGIEENTKILVNPNSSDQVLGMLVETESESCGQTCVNTSYTDYGSEFVAQALDAYKDSYAEYNTAIVTIKRNSGEGNDQVMNVASSTVANPDGTSYVEDEFNRTGLTLTLREMALIDYANKNFDTVVIVINAANTMELGFLQESDPNMSVVDGRTIYTDPYGSGMTMDVTNVKAAIWAGCCGSQGGYALANILTGDVNPSGHLPDIYARTLRNDPSYVNFGSFSYENSAELGSYADTTWFVEYEEGIYIGYRYHETAAAEAAKGNYEGYDYNTEVVYPFGYGLSYTTFSREFVGTPTYDAATETYTFQVKVTNTGSVAGKGVAQIYVNVPWEKGQVEKAHVVLGGFAKTEMLQPGKSETLTIEIKRDYFESYDYLKEKAYILDAGEYKFYLASDELGSHSWEAIDKMSAADQKKVVWSEKLDKKVVYNTEKRASDSVLATNAMDEELNWKFKTWNENVTPGDGYIYDFTRANFKGSFPTAPQGQDLVVTNEYAKKYIAKYVVAEDTENVTDEDGNVITSVPPMNVNNTSYTLSDMRGVDLDDPKWVDYIQQFTAESLANMYGNGGWGMPGDAENGVPATFDTDSPYGYYDHSGVASNNNRWYCGAPMLAATFNVKLAAEVGDAFGEEANCLRNEEAGVERINGIYAFGMNQHRSAFGGRNYEYYSEDPVLCGKMGAAEASAVAAKGLVVYMKHFVLNDQEAHRQDNGYCSFVNEQAFREVYLRAWELYIKEAECEMKYYDLVDNEYVMVTKKISAANGMMTAYNRIGGTYSGASLCINRILRAEWDFTGTILTDAGGEPHTYMTSDLALRRGQQLCLANNGETGLYDITSPVATTWLQKSGTYLLYNVANSNAMQGLAPGDSVYYETSPWKLWLNAAWIIAISFAVVVVVIDILVATNVIKLKAKTKKAEEDQY
ncbi:MAG: glycoside hydrolase family 3 C-terminal domain-containing protein [Clostridia bacterium]|nr:glycoside hydrolase family 3 C-terminal domain-containing protein [Clostridia bacterium]